MLIQNYFGLTINWNIEQWENNGGYSGDRKYC